jgi:cell wall-associated NlpC family hydrolase
VKPSRVLVGGAVGLMLAAVTMAGATGIVSASLLGNGPGGGIGGGAAALAPGESAADGIEPTALASTEIPAGMLALYRAAAATCPGLSWTVLAAIGTVESGNDTSDLPGVHSGANGAGAEGPMQFEPDTFAAYDEPVPAGGADPPSPYDPTDAVYAAARLLCADGASGGADVPAAVFAYNHDTAYVTKVLSLAQSYGQAAPPSEPAASAGAALAGAAGPGAAGVGAIAAAWALGQVGTPYIWGGETPGVGFDCSGLTQAAYRMAGLALPRVAQDQFDASPALPSGTELQPGDLVFFGSGPRDVSHVGIYLGVQGGRPYMVDAPHTGADVRVESFPTVPGAKWGADIFVGATRPSG